MLLSFILFRGSVPPEDHFVIGRQIRVFNDYNGISRKKYAMEFKELQVTLISQKIHLGHQKNQNIFVLPIPSNIFQFEHFLIKSTNNELFQMIILILIHPV